MGLTAQLNDLKQQLGREIPREILVEIGKFVQELAQSGIEETALRVGEKMPPFALPGASGQMVSAGDLLAKGNMVLSFYRGIW